MNFSLFARSLKNLLPSFASPVWEFRRPKLLGEVSRTQLTELGSQAGPVLNVNFTKDPRLEEEGSCLLGLWEVRVDHCSRSLPDGKRK